MDVFFKRNDFEQAALVAHEIMLQENAENVLTLAACLVACLKCVKKLGPTGDIVHCDESETESKEKVIVICTFLFSV